jgi:hypothetical protein
MTKQETSMKKLGIAWRQKGLFTGLHSVIPQKAELFIITVVRTSIFSFVV